MKKHILFILVILIAGSISAQEWLKNLPMDKLDNGTLTFFEIRDAAENHWNSLGVKDGYYIKDGVKTKAVGWKQFKRWEWYWENRIDPVTGEFPQKAAWQVFEDFKKEINPAAIDESEWINTGPHQTPGGYAGLGRINCVAFHPTQSNTIYVGSPSGGLWKTTDGGNTWTPLTDSNPVLGVSEIIVIPNGGTETLYIATGDRDGGSLRALNAGQENDNNTIGILKSTDGGLTWQTTGLSFQVDQNVRVNKIMTLPGNPSVLFASTTNGFYKSTDQGANWTQLITNKYSDFEFKPGNPQIMYAAYEKNYVPAKILRSTDGGSSWTVVKTFVNGVRTELAVSPDDPSRVYAVVSDMLGGLKSIYRSDNSGLTFDEIYDGTLPAHNILGWNCMALTPAGQGTYDLAIASDPNNADIVFVGGINTWKSVDGGENWDLSNIWIEDTFCSAPVVHADKHCLEFQNGTSVLFEGNDGGIYKTTNGGTSWIHIGNTLATSQIYRLSVSATNPGMVNTGLQDNGTKSIDAGVWSDIFPGDGMECIIDYTSSNIQYACQPRGSLYKTTDDWTTYEQLDYGAMGKGSWVTPYVLDPSNHNIIYLGYDQLWKSANQGDTWTQITSFSNDTADKIKSIAVAQSNTNVIYCAYNQTLYKSTNGGSNWTNVTGSLPVSQSYLTYVTIHSSNSDNVWVSLGQYNEYKVYETTDGGTSWSNISTGLPQLPVMCVIQNRQNTFENELYAGTDRGIYVRSGSSNWEMFSNGLPNVVVTELEIYYDNITPSNSRLIAATYGRGLWESELKVSLHNISVDLKIFLQGPFTGNIMGNGLNTGGQLPLAQPYNQSPWNYTGTESVSSIPNTDIVDWVLIELREAPSGSQLEQTVIAKQAGFILKDGSVTGTDGVSLLQFDNVPVQNFIYVVVIQRNHLSVMSSEAITESGGVYPYDFTTGPDKFYGGTDAAVQLATGIWGMAAGDGNADKFINLTDKNSIWKPQSGLKGYKSGDFNMDCQVNNGDKNNIWIPNAGMGSQVPE